MPQGAGVREDRENGSVAGSEYGGVAALTYLGGQATWPEKSAKGRKKSEELEPLGCGSVIYRFPSCFPGASSL